jgi:DNA-binding winged helix-turn-helix (wHTH) protein
MSSPGSLPNSPLARPNTRMVRFGIFELDLSSGKLSRKDYPVKLQQQPAQLLIFLIERAGTLVTRDELQGALWPSGTYVEFDDGLNTAMNRIRRTLGDAAATPRYIETIPKQGYRFVAPVEYIPSQIDLPPAPPLPAQTSEKAPPEIAVQPPRRRGLWISGGIAVLILAGTAIFWLTPSASSSHSVPLSAIRYTIALPQNHKAEALTISPEGDQIVYQGRYGESRMLYRRFLNAEESRPIPGTENARFPFFSPDGSEIGFYTIGKLKAVGASGVRELVSIPAGFVQYNAFWAQGGIYFNSMDAQGVGIWRVPAAGGRPERILNSAISEAGADFEERHERILDLFVKANRSMYLVCLSDQIQRIASYKP